MVKRKNSQSIKVTGSKRVKISGVKQVNKVETQKDQLIPRKAISVNQYLVKQHHLYKRIAVLRQRFQASGQNDFHRQLILLMNKLSVQEEEYQAGIITHQEYESKLGRVAATLNILESKLKKS